MALTHTLVIHSTRVPETPDEVIPAPVVYENAYARILTVRASPQYTGIVVAWFVDQAARESGAESVHLHEFSTDLSSLTGDIYPAAYNYLKTLPEFDGATDC